MTTPMTRLGLTVALTAAGCRGAEPPNPTAGQVPQRVAAVALSSGPTTTLHRAAGVVRAVQRAELSTRMAGRVESVRVRPGDRVRAGQLLVTLDAVAVDASVEQVGAGLELATTNLRRTERLYADSAVPLVQLEQARAQHAQAVAQSRAASAERRYASLTAPFAGVVSARGVDPGDLATPGRSLLTIEGDGPREVVLAVPEPVAARLGRGQTVTVRVGVNEQEIAATVAAVVPAANPASRTVEVRLTTRARPTLNLTAVADLPGEPGAGHLVVPRSAVVERGQLTGVFVFAPDSTVRLRWVRLGRASGAGVEVLSGLLPTDTVARVAAEAADGARARPDLGAAR